MALQIPGAWVTRWSGLRTVPLGPTLMANEPTLVCEGLANTPLGQHALRTGAGQKRARGLASAPPRLRYCRCIRSARGCAILDDPEALTKRKAGGQELMVELFCPPGRQLPVQKGAHFGLADIE
jgi:hypothetical protein